MIVCKVFQLVLFCFNKKKLLSFFLNKLFVYIFFIINLLRIDMTWKLFEVYIQVDHGFSFIY